MTKEHRMTFLFATTMMSCGSLLATDIYLPALPAMTQYFNCTQTDIQSTFTIFLLGLAACQLVYGVLADYFGEKKVALFGLSLFTVASFLCAFAVSLPEFILFRLLQAMGGGAGSVISRVMIRHRYNKTESVQIFSTIFPIVGLSAAIGPFIGGYLTYFFNWKANFYFMSGFGALALCLVLFFLSDRPQPIAENTENTEYNEVTDKFSRVAAYWDIFKNVNFLTYALIICTGFCVFRAYSIESPFVFNQQGFTTEEIGSFYIALSVTYILGNLTAKLFIKKISVEQLIKYGLSCSFLGGICMILLLQWFEHRPFAVILPMSMITFGNGLLFPTGSAAAMNSVESRFSGLGSGLMGALQFITAAFCVHWVGFVCQGQALSMALFICGIILLGILSFATLNMFRREKTNIREFESSGL